MTMTQAERQAILDAMARQFMQPSFTGEIAWYEISGDRGTEYVPCDVVGVTVTTTETGKSRFATIAELRDLDHATGECLGCDECSENESTRNCIPSALRQYCENIECWDIAQIKGFGARLSAPGYLDCTEWSVFPTLDEAEQYIVDTYGDDVELDEDEDEE